MKAEKENQQPPQLRQIEAELIESVRRDQVTWQRCYELVHQVEEGKL